MKTKELKKLVVHLLFGLWIVMTTGCVKENFTQTTDETPNISTYLKNNPDYALFYEAIKQAGVASYLDAWGTYTVFAPNNAAIQQYLQQTGTQSLADLGEAELKLLVNQHIVADTVTTGNFRDGKINKNSVSGQFITTSVSNIGGQAKIILNKEAVIVLANQRTGNGIVHGIDKVFTPITKTLMEQIQADPNLSLFAEALQATGLDATLNAVQEDEYISVLAVSNQTLAQRDFHNLQDLKDKYSHTGDPKNPQDSLYMHMAYHLVRDLKYVSDLMVQNSHTTQVPNEIVLVKVEGERVLINEENWLGTIEPGAEVDRENSDNTTKNGVLHYIKDNIFIKQRVPFPVYWDPADQPEIRASGIFRKEGAGGLGMPSGFLKDITWEGAFSVNYSNTNDLAVNKDYLQYRLRSSQIPSISFKTPILVKGRYRVWIAWRRMATGSNTGNVIETYFNGIKLARTFDHSEWRSTVIPAREYEALGYKRYTASTSASQFNCKMVGIIDVDVTDRHTLTLKPTTDRPADFAMDMVHFIPVDQEQIYPTFDIAGNAVYP